MESPDKGFTLVEISVGILVFSILSIGLFSQTQNTYRSVHTSLQNFLHLQNNKLNYHVNSYKMNYSNILVDDEYIQLKCAIYSNKDC